MEEVFIKGTVKAVIYHSDKNNFQIIKFSINNKYQKQLDKYFSTKTITIKGSFDRLLNEGEDLEITGNIVLDKNYGYQISVTEFKHPEITNKDALIKYLTSSMFLGIGELTAKRVIDKIGLDLINKVETDEHALDEVEIPDKLKKVIRDGILLDKTNNEAIMYFLNGGIPVEIASNIINEISLEHIDRIYNNPYIMIYLGIGGLTFDKIDQFSLNKGIAFNDIKRLVAICYHLISLEAEVNGCTYILKDKLFKSLTNYLYKEQIVISIEDFNNILDILNNNKKIVLEENRVFISFFHYAEYTSSKRLLDRINNENKKVLEFKKQDVKRNLDSIIEKLPFTLTTEQITAIKEAFLNNVLVITGGPGTGKTTIINTIVKLYSKLINVDYELSDCALLAPTGRASKRMEESSGHFASTIHRYLGYDGNQYNHNHDNPLKDRLVIVDESSMMDITLFYRLLDGINPNSRIIFVGDIDQLPAIGAGDVLSDLINSNVIKTIRLNEIFRQEEGSTIIPLSKMVNSGLIDNNIYNNKNDLLFIEEEYNIIDTIVDKLNEYMGKDYDLLTDIQIIAPQYKGANGIDMINNVIQDKVNHVKEDSNNKLIHGSRDFRLNDKVIQLTNKPDKQVMNGDIGYVDSFIYDKGKIKGLVVQFDDIKVEYMNDELNELKLAYAITVHKAQGSEFKIIIMPILKENYYMLKRKLLYTGITRAKELLVLIGSKQVFESSSRLIEEKRNTMLCSYLRELSGLEKSLYNKEEESVNFEKPFIFNVGLNEFINKNNEVKEEDSNKEENNNNMFDEFTF